MSALESMLRAVLGSMDIDVEALKAEATTRIKTFEANVSILNNTLIEHEKRLANIEMLLADIRMRLINSTTNEENHERAAPAIQHNGSVGNNSEASAGITQSLG